MVPADFALGADFFEAARDDAVFLGLAFAGFALGFALGFDDFFASFFFAGILSLIAEPIYKPWGGLTTRNNAFSQNILLSLRDECFSNMLQVHYIFFIIGQKAFEVFLVPCLAI